MAGSAIQRALTEPAECRKCDLPMEPGFVALQVLTPSGEVVLVACSDKCLQELLDGAEALEGAGLISEEDRKGDGGFTVSHRELVTAPKDGPQEVADSGEEELPAHAATYAEKSAAKREAEGARPSDEG